MSNGPDLYTNEPPSGMVPHLFRGADVRKATLVNGETDRPVKSICGTVRSYGPFEPVDSPDDESCGNCANKITDSDR